MAKKIRLRVRGMYGRLSPQEDMADMLRYDDGVVLEIELLDRTHYRAVVDVNQYTQARWESFMIQTKPMTYDTFQKEHNVRRN